VKKNIFTLIFYSFSIIFYQNCYNFFETEKAKSYSFYDNITREALGIVLSAVKAPVCIAIVAYTLIAIIKNKLKINRSTYEMLQLISVSLFDKTHLNDLLQSPVFKNVKEQKCQQLKIELI
jgi:hypothetical protein